MKYIVFDNPHLFVEIPVLFPAYLEHTTIANFHFSGWTPISAGFFNGTSAYGESNSLKIKSRPEDTDLILRCLTQ